jgi:hypothetical protein
LRRVWNKVSSKSTRAMARTRELILKS